MQTQRLQCGWEGQRSFRRRQLQLAVQLMQMLHVMGENEERVCSEPHSLAFGPELSDVTAYGKSFFGKVWSDLQGY